MQIAVAIAVLAIGVLVYLLDRQSGSAYFIPDWMSLIKNFNPTFAVVENYLPMFIHAFVFIILTGIFLALTSSQIVLIFVAWFVVDRLFEIVQITSIAQSVAGHTLEWLAGTPFLENASVYCINGTFDILNLISITLGAIAAYLTVQLTQQRGYISCS